jgi:hypothetical protein
MFLPNVSNHQPDYTLSQSGKPQYKSLALRKPQISLTPSKKTITCLIHFVVNCDVRPRVLMPALVCQLPSYLQDAEHHSGPALGQRHKLFWKVATCSAYISRVPETPQRIPRSGEWNQQLGLQLTLSV